MAFFRGSCVALLSTQADVEFMRGLKPRVAQLPVTLIGVCATPMESMLRSLGSVFERVYGCGDQSPQTGQATPDTINNLVKAEFGPVLAVLAFDDRPEGAAEYIKGFKRLRLPVYLVQRNSRINADAFGIWSPGDGHAGWGHTRPTRLALQSPGQAVRAAINMCRQPKAEFGVNGMDEIVYGRVPMRIALGRETVGRDGGRDLVAVEMGLLTPGVLTTLRDHLADLGVSCVEFEPHQSAEDVPSAFNRTFIVGCPADGAEAVLHGSRAVVLDRSGRRFDDDLSGYVVCADESELVSAVTAVRLRPPGPGRAAARLTREVEQPLMVDVLAQELLERYRRAATRAKSTRPRHVDQPTGVKMYDGLSSLRFPSLNLEQLDDELELPDVSRVVCLTHDWSDRTGLARPAKYYLGALAASGVDSLVLQLTADTTAEDVFAELRPTDFVVFNSIGVFERFESSFDVYAALSPHRRALYLHETAFTMDRFAEKAPANHARFSVILPSAPLLCVSEKQAAWFRAGYGATTTFVVYNTTSLPSANVTRTTSATPTVLMSGTIQPRKGVELFSRVADLAKRRGLDWTFQWAGHSTEEADGLYQSNNVQWLGRLDGAALTAAMAGLDVFFLSSIDDPFPLSALEAIQMGKRVVVYSETGIEEIVARLPGCAVYSHYDAASALQAVETALAEAVDARAYAAVETEVFSLRAFVSRMSCAIQQISRGAA